MGPILEALRGLLTCLIVEAFFVVQGGMSILFSIGLLCLFQNAQTHYSLCDISLSTGAATYVGACWSQLLRRTNA